MKSKEELKKELHLLIDSIEDEETLNMLHEDLMPYVTELSANDEESEDELTPEQELRLNEAMRQADAGEVISIEEFYSRMARWHTK